MDERKSKVRWIDGAGWCVTIDDYCALVDEICADNEAYKRFLAALGLPHPTE